MKEPSNAETRMSDAQFAFIIALIGCPLAAAGVFLEIPLLLVFGIMLAPIAFMTTGRPVIDS